MLVQERTTEHRIILDFSDIIDLNDDMLFEFCRKNRELRIERSDKGEIVIMLPVGGEGGSRESILIIRLGTWNDKHKLGKVFSSATGFRLPDGAMRSPDVSYITIERWKAIPKEQRKKFAPICPDFICELRSETDQLTDLKNKMNEWMDNGCRLGWLIDPLEEKVYIYRPQKDVELISSFDEKLSGEEVLKDFELELHELREEE